MLAGHWNRMIFTPPFVGQRLFQQAQLETLVPLTPRAPVVFQNEHVALNVAPARLELKPRTLANADLTAVEEMATRAMEQLPDTPMIGIGCNFLFVESAPSDEFLGRFNFEDAGDLGTLGWEAAERQIVRRLIRNGQTLNLKLVFGGQDVLFDFNFHHDVQTAQQGIEALRGNYLGMKESAIQVLRDVYDFQLEGV